MADPCFICGCDADTALPDAKSTLVRCRDRFRCGYRSGVADGREFERRYGRAARRAAVSPKDGEHG